MLREMQAFSFKFEMFYSGSEVCVPHKIDCGPIGTSCVPWRGWGFEGGDIWFTWRTTETVSVQFFSDGLAREGGTDKMLPETSVTNYQPTPHNILRRAKISAARRRKPESWHSCVTVWTYVFRPDYSVALYYILQGADSDLANWLKAT